MRVFLSFLLIGVVLAAPGCDERKSSPVGGEVIDRDDLGQFETVHLQPAAQDTVVQGTLSMYQGPRLLVGEWSGYQTKSLLKFEVLPESDSITSASLTLITDGLIDTETTVQPFVPETLYIVTSLLETDWSGSDVTFDTPLSQTPIETVAVGRSPDDTMSIPLPTEVVQGWIDETGENHGILLGYDEAPLTPQGAGFVKMFYSSNSQIGPPRLSITWALTDTSDTTVSVIPTADVFVVRRTSTWPFDPKPHQLMVGNGIAYRSLLQFFVEDSIPEDATIIRGEVTLYVDPDFSFFSSLDVGIYAVTNSSWEEPEFDSNQIIWATVTNDSVVFAVQSLIQDWITGKRPNYGFMLKSIHEDWDIASFVFHSSQSDPDFTPKLEVKYVTPPDFNPKESGVFTLNGK